MPVLSLPGVSSHQIIRLLVSSISPHRAKKCSDYAASQREERAVVHHVRRAGAVHAGGDAHAVPAAQLGTALCDDHRARAGGNGV